MKKYLSEYIMYIENAIKNADDSERLNSLLKEHLDKIQFMQHERLIHFLVTILFVFVFFAGLAIWSFTQQLGFLLLVTIVLGLLIPYIMHYYFLENTVQKMYVIYDNILKKIRKK